MHTLMVMGTATCTCVCVCFRSVCTQTMRDLSEFVQLCFSAMDTLTLTHTLKQFIESRDSLHQPHFKLWKGNMYHSLATFKRSHSLLATRAEDRRTLLVCPSSVKDRHLDAHL